MVTKGKHPTIDASTPIGDLMICVQAILASEAGRCAKDVIVARSDPRVAVAPQAFLPLINYVENRAG